MLINSDNTYNTLYIIMYLQKIEDNNTTKINIQRLFSGYHKVTEVLKRVVKVKKLCEIYIKCGSNKKASSDELYTELVISTNHKNDPTTENTQTRWCLSNSVTERDSHYHLTAQGQCGTGNEHVECSDQSI